MSEDTKKTETAKVPEMEINTIYDHVITVKGEEGRVYRFTMPFRAPLTECYYAAVNAANEVSRLFRELVEKQKAKEAEDKKKLRGEPEDKKEEETPK